MVDRQAVSCLALLVVVRSRCGGHCAQMFRMRTTRRRSRRVAVAQLGCDSGRAREGAARRRPPRALQIRCGLGWFRVVFGPCGGRSWADSGRCRFDVGPIRGRDFCGVGPAPGQPGVRLGMRCLHLEWGLGQPCRREGQPDQVDAAVKRLSLAKSGPIRDRSGADLVGSGPGRRPAPSGGRGPPRRAAPPPRGPLPRPGAGARARALLPLHRRYGGRVERLRRHVPSLQERREAWLRLGGSAPGALRRLITGSRIAGAKSKEGGSSEVGAPEAGG